MADQLLGAVHGLVLAADARRIDEDFADQVLRLGGRRVQARELVGHLIVGDANARSEHAAHQALPADLGADLVAQRGQVHAGGAEGRLQLGEGEVVLLGEAGDFLVHFLVVGDQAVLLVALLTLLHPLQFLHFQVFVGQRAQGFLFHLGQGLLGRLHAGGQHQQAHALLQVVGGDDVVVDHRRDGAGGDGWGRGRSRGGGGRRRSRGRGGSRGRSALGAGHGGAQ